VKQVVVTCDILARDLYTRDRCILGFGLELKTLD